MAEKKQVQRGIKQLQRVKTWQLVILLIIVGFLAATFLRLNNIGMIERRAAVIAADEAGDSEATTQRLYDLQRYVSAHMNTDLGDGVPLQASYDRAVDKAVEAAVNDGLESGNVYKAADEYCAPQFRSYSTAYLNCFLDQLQKHPAGKQLATDFKKPLGELYMHDYDSPLWSPDFAGWTVLLAALILLVIIVRLTSLGVLHLMLRRHYKSL